jgi:hypothetical protein
MRSRAWIIISGVFTLAIGSSAACASGASATTGCSGLSACCGTLSGVQAEACNDTVSASMSDSECTMALDEYQSSGLCESGGGDGSADAGGCGALATCCADLPVTENPTECTAVASGGTTKACDESLATYVAAGFCREDAGVAFVAAGECGQLATCCDRLSTVEAEACTEIALSATVTEAECGETLSSYEAAGACGSAGTGGFADAGAMVIGGCAPGANLMVTVTEEGLSICDASVVAVDGSVTLALETTEDGEECSYSGNVGSSGGDFVVEATAPGYPSGETTLSVSGYGCTVGTIEL